MPTERLSMRRIRQILQLHFGAQASARTIARELGVARSTVQGYLARASSADLGWPLPADLTDPMLEERLFPPAKLKPGVRRYVEPDWAALAREMKRSGVNLMILWEEYQQVHPEGYGYSRFVADAHGLIVRKIEPQSMCNLLRTPRQGPTPVLSRSVSAPFPGNRRPGNGSAAWCHDQTSQSILHIRPQRHVNRQFRRLRAAASPFSMPLCRGSPIVQSAAARRSITSQFARDRRRRTPHLPGDLSYPRAPRT
jgi:hypothetical protein